MPPKQKIKVIVLEPIYISDLVSCLNAMRRHRESPTTIASAAIATIIEVINSSVSR